ncbi:MAG: DUF2309 domain-containing protein, partial [Deltaproteobacteria bacterium]|nr:DUF2309 domain-containing protein [Deltaproteobacteria bacterium]
MSTPTTLAAAVADRAQRAPSCEADREGENDAIFAALAHAIDHAAHLLPAQGPISVFIHHNTLHAFEEATFTEALKTASQTFGCHPYLPEARYREELLRGRIRFGDMEAVLREDLGATASARIVPGCTRLELRLAMLQYPLRLGPTPELLWFVAETDALRRVRSDVSAAARAHLLAEARRWAMRDLRGVSTHLTPLLERFGQSQIENWSEAQWEAFTLQALWRICCNRLGALPDPTPAPRWPVRHRDLLLQATGEDADLLVHEILIRFCAAYLDQGLAHWRLPLRDEGFYRAFIALYRQAGGPPNHWLRGLARQLEQLADQNVSPLACIHQSLGLLGVPADEWPAYINASLLGLRGWAGMIRFVEQRGDRAVQPIPAGSLVEFLAIRLILDRLAAAHVSRRALGVDIPLAELRDNLRLMLPSRQPASVEQRAFTVFQLAQALGLAPPELEGLSDDQWKLLLAEIEAFSTVERQRIFHLAYERRFATQTLDAIAQHNAAPPPAPPVPRFQAMFCIDEREESLRRHLEEIAPDCSTYGIAGFYFVAMYYRGVDDAHFTPLCPAVIQPQHWVAEKVDEHLETALERRARARRALGEAAHRIHLGSRRFATGALLSGVVGLLASVPLIARTFVPRLTAKFRKAFGKWVFDLPPTRLQLQRSDAQPGPENGAQGFTLGELCGIAERVLRDTGLTSNFAPLVLTIGHGSTSMNNPHESAHDCGACGG